MEYKKSEKFGNHSVNYTLLDILRSQKIIGNFLFHVFLEKPGSDVFSLSKFNYFHHVHAFVIVVDEASSYGAIWIVTEYFSRTYVDAVICFVCSKTDLLPLQNQSNVVNNRMKMNEFTEVRRFGFSMDVSTKTGENLREFFEQLTKDVLRRSYSGGVVPWQPRLEASELWGKKFEEVVICLLICWKRKGVNISQMPKPVVFLILHHLSFILVNTGEAVFYKEKKLEKDKRWQELRARKVEFMIRKKIHLSLLEKTSLDGLQEMGLWIEGLFSLKLLFEAKKKKMLRRISKRYLFLLFVVFCFVFLQYFSSNLSDYGEKLPFKEIFATKISPNVVQKIFNFSKETNWAQIAKYDFKFNESNLPTSDSVIINVLITGKVSYWSTKMTPSDVARHTEPLCRSAKTWNEGLITLVASSADLSSCESWPNGLVVKFDAKMSKVPLHDERFFVAEQFIRQYEIWKKYK